MNVKRTHNMAMLSQRGFVILQDLLGGGGDLVALLTYGTRVRCNRFGVKRVDGGVRTPSGNRTRQHGGSGVRCQTVVKGVGHLGAGSGRNLLMAMTSSCSRGSSATPDLAVLLGVAANQGVRSPEVVPTGCEGSRASLRTRTSEVRSTARARRSVEHLRRRDRAEMIYGMLREVRGGWDFVPSGFEQGAVCRVGTASGWRGSWIQHPSTWSSYNAHNDDQRVCIPCPVAGAESVRTGGGGEVA